MWVFRCEVQRVIRSHCVAANSRLIGIDPLVDGSPSQRVLKQWYSRRTSDHVRMAKQSPLLHRL
jgi:hypothetical protein